MEIAVADVTDHSDEEGRLAMSFSVSSMQSGKAEIGTHTSVLHTRADGRIAWIA